MRADELQVHRGFGSSEPSCGRPFGGTRSADPSQSSPPRRPELRVRPGFVGDPGQAAFRRVSERGLELHHRTDSEQKVNVEVLREPLGPLDQEREDIVHGGLRCHSSSHT